jgi:hypothetical protein
MHFIIIFNAHTHRPECIARVFLKSLHPAHDAAHMRRSHLFMHEKQYFPYLLHTKSSVCAVLRRGNICLMSIACCESFKSPFYSCRPTSNHNSCERLRIKTVLQRKALRVQFNFDSSSSSFLFRMWNVHCVKEEGGA